MPNSSFLITGGGAAGPLVDALHDELSKALDPRLEKLGPGVSIGNFVLLRRLGAGGFSVVYLAERLGNFTQRVAIKISLAADTTQHFHAERELLARLEHPNIVRIIDGGEFEGLAWAAMEYVDGEPLDVACDTLSLNWLARVKVMEHIADALHYAHQRQIVHGDIKPANILVDRDGQPRILDFGIARSTLPGNEECAKAFTPAYASPEQARGELVTTASDIYQVGLLAKDVFDPSRVRMPALARANLDALRSRLCAAAPEARVESMSAARDDLLRVGQFEPCRAFRWPLRKRVRFFLRRNARASAWVLGCMVTILTLLILASVRISQEAGRTAAAVHAAQVNSDFLRNLFRMSAPAAPDTTIVDVLDQGSHRLLDVVARSAQDTAILTETLSAAYLDVERPERALELVNALGKAGDADATGELSVELLVLKARALAQLARADEARWVLRALDTKLTSAPSTPATETARMAGARVRASLQRRDGQMDVAGRTLRDAIAANSAASAWERSQAYSDLGAIELLTDRPADAVNARRKALSLVEDAFGSAAPASLVAQRKLAYALSATGAVDEANAILDRQEHVITASYGETSIEQAALLAERGIAATRRGDFSTAADFFRRELAIRQTNGVGQTAIAASTRHNLAGALAESGHVPEAIALLREALAIRLITLSPQEQVVLMNRIDLAQALCLGKQFAESEALFESALDDYQRVIQSLDTVHAVTRYRCNAS